MLSLGTFQMDAHKSHACYLLLFPHLACSFSLENYPSFRGPFLALSWGPELYGLSTSPLLNATFLKASFSRGWD